MNKGLSRAAAAGLGWLAVALAATSLHAQETNPVGNPQLKDFELPGTRTTPPAEQQPAPATPPPAANDTPPTPAETPVAPPPEVEAETGDSPAAAPHTTLRRPSRRAAARPSTVVPPGVPAPSELELALPSPAPATPRTKWEPPAPLSEPAPAARIPWFAIGAGTLLALLALLALVAFRKARASGTERAETEAPALVPEAAPEPQPEPDPLFARRPRPPAAAPAPAPAPLPAAAPAKAAPTATVHDEGVVGISLRPRLELQFKPDRAAATLTETSVQYELSIRNVGNRVARNVRVQARMFNAGSNQDQEISAFFAASSPMEAPPSIATIAPRSEVQLKSVVTLPKDQVREVTIQGRRLFIPLVAFNVLYEWEGGRTGQTSMSYLVGREAPTPQEKMGAFRLDLGPRLYRSVGQRQAALAKVV